LKIPVSHTSTLHSRSIRLSSRCTCRM
jgi:hypothetical protein